MDQKQFDKVVPMLHAAQAAEGQCGNLKHRLPLAGKELKAKAEWKDVADAAAKFLKKVEPAYSEIGKLLKIGEKDIRAMSVPDYKKKAEKMLVTIKEASDAGTAYWSAYQGARKKDVKIDGCVSANASGNYAGNLIKAATDTKIAYNSLK